MTRIIWFRNDLRVSDNPALFAAGGGGGSAPRRGPSEITTPVAAHADRLLPVFIFPPRLFATTSFGFPKIGPHRARFLLETLEGLRRALQERGSDLIICRGEPVYVLLPLAEHFGAEEICYQEEAGPAR